MAIVNDMQAVCSKCRETSTIEIYNSINTAAEPQLKQKVLDGSMFLWTCPHCGGRNLARFQTIYHDPDARLMVWVLPEESVNGKDRALLEGHMKSLEETISAQNNGRLDDYVFRRVEDAGSLIEKIKIRDAGLDDVVMELCKYVTRMEVAGNEKDRQKASEILNATFRFFQMDGADNELTFAFTADGQMKTVKTGFNMYEDSMAIISRHTGLRPSGFSKIDSAWISSMLK